MLPDTDTLTRPAGFDPDATQYRSLEVREVTEDMEVVGLAVPYGQRYEVGGFAERFEQGAVDASTAHLYYGHDHRHGGMPIGRVVESWDTPEGHMVRARISDTAKGREVHALLRDGVLDRFSLGFNPDAYRIEDEGTTVVHTRVRAIEVSVVANPAYDGAHVTEVRSETHPTTKGTPIMETTEIDVADLRDAVTDLERQLAVLSAAPTTTGPVFRSGGALLKALAAGDTAAMAEFRAADSTGPATSVQAGAGFANGANWIDQPLRLVQENRQLLNLFSKGPLPAAGNTIEFPRVATTSGTVTKQAAEGAALSYMEIELETGTATVGTYGGYSRLSRQSIERSDEAYLEAVLRYQALQYAKATESDFRNAVVTAAGTAKYTLSGDNAVSWIDAVIDAAGYVEDNSLGLTADFIVVSRDVFKRVAHIVDGAGRPIFAVNGDGQNTIGSAGLVSATFNIGGLRGVVAPRMAANTAIVASADAVVSRESAGAPFRLEDENVVNLTKDFSLYGYMAWTVPDAAGLVKLDVDLVA